MELIDFLEPSWDEHPYEDMRRTWALEPVPEHPDEPELPDVPPMPDLREPAPAPIAKHASGDADGLRAIADARKLDAR